MYEVLEDSLIPLLPLSRATLKKRHTECRQGKNHSGPVDPHAGGEPSVSDRGDRLGSSPGHRPQRHYLSECTGAGLSRHQDVGPATLSNPGPAAETAADELRH